MIPRVYNLNWLKFVTWAFSMIPRVYNPAKDTPPSKTCVCVQLYKVQLEAKVLLGHKLTEPSFNLYKMQLEGHVDMSAVYRFVCFNLYLNWLKFVTWAFSMIPRVYNPAKDTPPSNTCESAQLYKVQLEV